MFYHLTSSAKLTKETSRSK